MLGVGPDDNQKTRIICNELVHLPDELLPFHRVGLELLLREELIQSWCGSQVVLRSGPCDIVHAEEFRGVIEGDTTYEATYCKNLSPG